MRWMPLLLSTVACTAPPPPGPGDSDPVADGANDPGTGGSGSDSAGDTGFVAGADADQDGVPDVDDLCPDVPDPDQRDADLDDVGDACDDDRDGDLIPDFDASRGLSGPDRWPDDPQWPGTGDRDAIYAHTRDTLFRFVVRDESVSEVGVFDLQVPSASGWSSITGEVTDLAIDQYGVVYAITFTDLYACNPRARGTPARVACRQLGPLPTVANQRDFNGLTLLPPGAAGPEPVMIAMRDRYWFEVDATADPPTGTQRGTYGPSAGYSGETYASGDAFSIQGVGTFASVHRNGLQLDAEIVELDPTTGAILRQVVDLPTLDNRPWGLAGWSDGRIYVFDAGGTVFRFDPNVTNPTLEALTGPGVDHAWWGAAVRTVFPTP